MKLLTKDFLESGVSTYDFSTLHTTLPHNLIKEKLTELIEQTFNREGSFYLNNLKHLNCGHGRKYVALTIIFWTIYL